MANGYWGRFPLGNIFCSKIIFLMLKYRLIQLRFYNNYKRIFYKPKVASCNTISTRQDLMKWLNQGYNKINIGGGSKNIDGFVNIDFVIHPNVQRQVTANILDISFIPDESISHIHSNHLIEHLTEIDLKNQLREWYRILKRDGLISIRCPNTLGVAYGFWFDPIIESEKEEFIKFGFPADEDFGNTADKWVYKDFFGLVHWLYGDMGNIANQHLSRITPSMLRRLLVTQGFNVLKMTEPEAINIVVVAYKGSYIS